MVITSIHTTFNAAKRLADFGGICGHIHGYTHRLEVSFSKPIDFYAAKNTLDNWLKTNFEHNLLLNEQDKLLGDYIAKYTNQTPYYFQQDPTCEYMAEYLAAKIIPKLFPSISIHSLTLHDGDSGKATFF
jgi:6-pyruvoyl-tetrahydropterin synthase